MTPFGIIPPLTTHALRFMCNGKRLGIGWDTPLDLVKGCLFGFPRVGNIPADAENIVDMTERSMP